MYIAISFLAPILPFQRRREMTIIKTSKHVLLEAPFYWVHFTVREYNFAQVGTYIYASIIESK